MHKNMKRFLLISLIVLLLVGVVYSCCSCAIQSTASTISETKAQESKNSYIKVDVFDAEKCQSVLDDAFSGHSDFELYTVLKGYSKFLDNSFSSSVITRGEWLSVLTQKLGVEVVEVKNDEYVRFIDKDYFDNSEYVITAIENGFIGSGGVKFDPYCAATRQYVATSLVNAVDYPPIYNTSISDYNLIEDKAQATVAVYLGYFELDENNCFNPYDRVTQEQVDYILSELDKVLALEGKTVMAFGDSIMHGDGNRFVGIADMLSQRYKMTPVDYSKGGATFSTVKDREQISDQIRRAVKNKEEADIILINGGTNDMRKSLPGTISQGFNYQLNGRADFASGMEYALGLLRDNYPDTPVVYIRAHDMEYGIERNELHFGTIALDICDKWEIDVVDIFNDTDFNAHDDELKSVYTVHTKLCKNGDSIHPNRLGYYKFYLPLVSDKAVELLNNTVG